jgi:hypothetical protein
MNKLEIAKKMHERNIEELETQEAVAYCHGKEQPKFFTGVELEGKFYTMEALMTNKVPTKIKEDYNFDFDLAKCENEILEEFYSLEEFIKVWNNDEYYN